MAPFVTVLAAGTYGLVRLRMPLDIALVVLAAVPIERLLARRFALADDPVSATGTDERISVIAGADGE